MKWGQGCWTLDGDPKVYIHAEPDHLHFGFFTGAKLDDPEGLLVGSGKHVLHVKVFTGKDIAEKEFGKLIKQVLWFRSRVRCVRPNVRLVSDLQYTSKGGDRRCLFTELLE